MKLNYILQLSGVENRWTKGGGGKISKAMQLYAPLCDCDQERCFGCLNCFGKVLKTIPQ